MGQPSELHGHIVNPAIAAPVQTVNILITAATDGDQTVQNIFCAPRKMKFIGGKYIQEANATAATSFVMTLQVGATAISQALDIKTLGADAAGSILASATEANTILAAGSKLDAVFNETGGTATAPDAVCLSLEFQLLE